MIKLKNVYKVYNNTEFILENISLTLPNIGLFTLLGPSGCGKSTLLNIIGGMDSVTSGEITVLNKNIVNMTQDELADYRNSEVGFIFQDFHLIDDLTVYDNISIIFGRKEIDEQYLNSILKYLEIENLKDRKIEELSGGQKARVGIARALIKKPKIILADEPTGNLDSNTAKAIWNILKAISSHILVIACTHDEESANFYSDSILKIINRQIEIKQKTNIIENEIKSYQLSKHTNPIWKLCKQAYFKNNVRNIIISTLFLCLFIILTISINLTTVNLPKSEAIAVANNYGASHLVVSKKNTMYSAYINFNEEDITSVTDYLDSHRISYEIPYTIGDLSIRYDLSQNKKYISESYSLITSGTLDSISSFNMTEKDDFKWDYIGEFPENKNEIMISNVLADLIIYYGATDMFENAYTPSSYEEILSDGKYILFQDFDKMYYFKVKGIYKLPYDLEKFKTKKIEYTIKDGSKVPVYDEETLAIASDALIIYVNKNFFKIMESPEMLTIDDTLYQFYVEQNSQNIIITNEWPGPVPQSQRNEFKLNDNEIIINRNTLNLITNNKYAEEYNRQTEMAEKEFAMKYMNEKSIMGSSIKIIVSTYNNNNSISYETYNLTIAGYNAKISDSYNDYIYISDNIIAKYLKEQAYTLRININFDNQDTVEQLINHYQNDNKFNLATVYYEKFADIKPTASTAVKISRFLAPTLLLIIVLFINIITYFILNKDKEKLSILKSLGYRNGKICKIYTILFILLTLFPLIITFIIISPLLNIINNYICNEFKVFNTTFIFLNWYTIPAIIICYIFFTIILIEKQMKKIVKLNPVDILRKND